MIAVASTSSKAAPVVLARPGMIVNALGPNGLRGKIIEVTAEFAVCVDDAGGSHAVRWSDVIIDENIQPDPQFVTRGRR